MRDNETMNLVKQAKNGDPATREQLIEQSRPFVLQEAQRICRRTLEWGKDDELSIALMAFNEAIDAFREEKGSSFQSLARLLIKRRLIDHFRKNAASAQPTAVPVETLAIEEDWEQGERQREIQQYGEILKTFGLSFQSLVRNTPKHKRTRETLQKAAVILSTNQDLMTSLHKNRKLPQGELCRLAETTPRVLERGRSYVIALALLLEGEKFPYLKDYVKLLTGKRGE